MATVRELVTKIKFAVDKSGVNEANNAANSIKRDMEDSARAAGNFQDKLGRWHAANGKYLSMTEKNVLGLGNSVSRVSSKISTLGNASISSFGVAGGAVDALAGKLGALAGAVAAAFSIGKIKESADSMMNLDNKMRVLFDNESERLEIKERIYELSKKDRVEYEAMGDLVYKVARAGSQFGISMEDSLRVSDIVSKGLNLGGATTQESNAAILQLGQALSSGRLQGDELRSLGENASSLMQHVADKFGVTTGQLRDMGAQGLLTTDVLVKAILDSGKAIDDEFSTHVPTIGQAITGIGSTFDRMVDRVEEKTGVFGNIATNLIKYTNYAETEILAFVDILNGNSAKAEEHPTIAAFVNGLKKVENEINYAEGEFNKFQRIFQLKRKLAAGDAESNPNYQGENGALQYKYDKFELGQLSEENPALTTISNLFTSVSSTVQTVGEAIYEILSPAINFAKNHTEEFFALAKPGLDSLKDGVDKFGQAWENIQPFIEVITPLLKIIAEVIGVLIVGAVLTLWNLWTAAFKSMMWLVERLTAVLGWCGEMMKIIWGYLGDLIGGLRTFFGLTSQLSSSGGAMDQHYNNAFTSQEQNFVFNVPSVGGIKPAYDNVSIFSHK